MHQCLSSHGLQVGALLQRRNTACLRQKMMAVSAFGLLRIHFESFPMSQGCQVSYLGDKYMTAEGAEDSTRQFQFLVCNIAGGSRIDKSS